MSSDMNLPGWIGGIATGIGAIIVGLRQMFVTRTELAAAVEDIRREQQQNHIEFRNEQREMHAENRGMLERIHERVDALWERRQRLRE